MNEKLDITRHSVFTEQVLIMGADKSWELNTYGNHGMFIARVRAIDQTNHKIEVFKFESEVLSSNECTTENWQIFNRKVDEYCKATDLTVTNKTKIKIQIK